LNDLIEANQGERETDFLNRKKASRRRKAGLFEAHNLVSSDSAKEMKRKVDLSADFCNSKHKLYQIGECDNFKANVSKSRRAVQFKAKALTICRLHRFSRFGKSIETVKAKLNSRRKPTCAAEPSRDENPQWVTHLCIGGMSQQRG
jgi:hypothetical protein